MSANLIFEVENDSIFLGDLIQQFFLMRLQELYLFDESGESSFILVILHLLLIFHYALLVVLECLFHSGHVIFIRIDELGLLSL